MLLFAYWSQPRLTVNFRWLVLFGLGVLISFWYGDEHFSITFGLGIIFLLYYLSTYIELLNAFIIAINFFNRQYFIRLFLLPWLLWTMLGHSSRVGWKSICSRSSSLYMNGPCSSWLIIFVYIGIYDCIELILSGIRLNSYHLSSF